MRAEIVVPTLGESVSEATIAKWYKKPGEAVKVDELLLELETEKVTLEVNATAEGVLENQKKQEGDIVAPGEVIGIISSGTTSLATPDVASDAPAQFETPITPEEKPSSVNHSANKMLDPVTTMPPSVRRIVAENNLNPANIDATGKDGRITKEDALAAINSAGKVVGGGEGTNINLAPSASQNSSSENKPLERVRMSRLRKTIAQRLKDSQNNAAILSTFNEIDMTNVISLRQRLKDEFQDKHGVKLGFMSFFVKAVTNALKEIPSVNSEIDGDDIIYKKFYDIGVAVGTEQGLVVPVVRDCDKLGFADIEKNIVTLAKKAREGKLAMTDLTGGTFSITNGGVYGSLLSTPIINPPQTGILGLHNTQERPVVIDGKIEVRQMMYIALSYDHRIIDGKDAVTFLVKIKKSIEDPERLMLDM